MAIEAIIARYGLLAIFLGAGIEGEAVVVTGGVLAHAGVFPLWQAIAAATVGSCVVDQFWFQLARRFRNGRWIVATKKRAAFARALSFLERYPNSFIFGFRFIYGLRTVSPIAIGASDIAAAKFIALNAFAAAIWAPMFTMIGYWLGKAAGPLLQDTQTLGIILVAVIVLIAIASAAFAWFRRTRPGTETS